MRSRQDLTEIFSTYIHFEFDRFSGWLAEPRLRKSFERCLSEVSTAQAAEKVWALYWYRHWQGQTHRLAMGHLGAYLQEAGYWAAHNFTSRFELKQFSLADCFQVAFAQLEQGLRSFQPERGNTLAAFAKMFFKSTITNELRRAQELDLCSDWLLLRRTARKRFIESLRNVGLDPAEVERYRLAWMCFQRLYAPHRETGIQQLPPPRPETWQAIADLYNRERGVQLGVQLGVRSQPITAAQIETWLRDAIGWIRMYLQPAVGSLNAAIPGMETGELQDNLPANDLSPMENLLEIGEHAARQAQQDCLRQVLKESVSTLELADQSLLRLYYQEHCTQQKIAQQLGIKQYAVSRKLTRVRKRLLGLLVAWSQEKEGMTHTPETIEHIAEVLEGWLQHYFDAFEPGGA